MARFNRPASNQALVVLAVAGLLVSCGSQKSEANAATAKNAPPSAAEAASGFDPLSVPVSTHELGDFPFVTAPQGYAAPSPKSVDLEEKYIYAGGAVRTVAGRYFHTKVHVDGGVWNETRLLRDLEAQITELGGVRIFDGPLPEVAATRIREDQPNFVKDLYDPWPYRFRQYLIRTAAERVWIEIGYGYNAEMIDLTVVQENTEAETPAQ